MADEVIQTPFGKFLITPRDVVESTLKAGTLWDGPGFLQPIAIEHGRLGEAGVTILDVGANVGSFTIWLASRGAWRVVAVEPVPQTLDRLKANLDLNQAICADTVIVIPHAAYSHVTRLEPCQPYDPANQGGAALRPIDGAFVEQSLVSAIPLDQYRALFGSRISLIKIDAQGCDLHVLRGLTATIGQHRPAIVFEWESELAALHHTSWGEAEVFLQQIGYTWVRWPSHPDNVLALPVR